MRIQSRISALAFAAAILATPQLAFGQISLGVNLGGNSDNGGLGLGAGVDLGIGDTNVNVDAGVGVGGDSLVDADVDIRSNSSGNNGGGLNVGAEVLGNDRAVGVSVGTGTRNTGNGGNLGVDATVLGDDGLVDADVTLGNGRTTGGTANPRPSQPALGVRVSALDDAARVEALIGQIDDPQLAGADLDDLIDDTRVSIVALADILGEDEVDDIRARVELGGAGREELLAAIDASVELGSILDRQGLGAGDVISLSVSSDGSAELLVVDLDIGLASADDAGEDATDLSNLADLDIDLLTDDELAQIDLALLPNEQQRLDAVIRLLGGSDADASAGDDFELVAVDALLGEQSLADLDAILGGEDSETVLVTADLLGILDDAGLSPEAVIGLDTRPDRPTRVFVNTGLGENGTLVGDLVNVDLSIGTGSIGSGDDGSGNGGGNGNGDGGNGDGGNGDGGNGDGGTGGNGNGDGGSGNGDGGNGTGGNGGGNTGGDGTPGGGTGTPGGGNGTPGGGNGTPGGGTGGNGGVAGIGGNANMPAALAPANIVVAEVSCEAGLVALGMTQAPVPSDLASVDDLALVAITGCIQTLRQDELAALRDAVEAQPEIRMQVDSAGLALDDLVGGVLENGTLTLYFDTETSTAA